MLARCAETRLGLLIRSLLFFFRLDWYVLTTFSKSFAMPNSKRTETHDEANRFIL
jgi:hypothetical protein